MSDKKKERIRALKFLLFSMSAGVIQLGSDALMVAAFHTAPWVAYLVSLILSVIWNFTFNRKFTFQSAANIPIAMLKVAAFYAVFAPLSTWWTKVLTEPEYNICWNFLVVQLLTMLVNLVTEFLYQRFFVFGKSIDTAVKEEK
jgi:putative flippase GtrA